MPSTKLWLPSLAPNQTALILCPATDLNVSSRTLNKHHPEVWKWFIWDRDFMKSQLEVLDLVSDAKADERHYNTPALQIRPRRGGLPGSSYICSGPLCGIQQDLGFPVHCATEQSGYGLVQQPTAHKWPQLLSHILLTATMKLNISPTTATSAVVSHRRAKSKEGCKKWQKAPLQSCPARWAEGLQQRPKGTWSIPIKELLCFKIEP